MRNDDTPGISVHRSTSSAPASAGPRRSAAATSTAAARATPTPMAAAADDREARPARGRARALLSLARPRQWVKNLLVIAAPGAAGALGHDGVPVRLTVACVAFCLLSAGIYALNDVRDREEDRRHPRKRFRPVAAGEVHVSEAVAFGLAAMAGGIVLCVAVTPALALVGLGYLAVTISYSWFWRHVPVLDLAALAAGFVLRAIAGGVAAPVGLSRWFVLVITFAAVFVAAGKRLAELGRATAAGREPRLVLSRYSPRGLGLAFLGAGAGALFAYCVWAFALPSVAGVPWRLLTIPPFALCLTRYAFLVRAGEGEAPEEAVIADPVMVVASLVWLIVFALGVNAAG